ncbi:hypothetical protein SAMN05192575_11643 [Nocardioides alpinus]|uniref:Uncharacterized protein n=1 Tax=Nocardioides alpinus TaxID=748909 RepID=A0A1I1BHB5_9ACTN|nr:hypothetical protein SAMN05192575_11643 [Nocardioides alpinus]
MIGSAGSVQSQHGPIDRKGASVCQELDLNPSRSLVLWGHGILKIQDDDVG